MHLISVSIRGHKGKSERGGRKSGEDSGQAANCRAEMVSERRKERQFAACPESCVCRSRLRRCSGTPRPDGRLAGIRMAYLRRWASLPRSGVGARRSAGFERILRPAALAFPMAQDAAGDPRVCDEGDDPHAGATGADQRVHFEDFSEQARPRAPGFRGGVGIVLLRLCFCCGTGAVASGGRNGDSGPVRVGAVEPLAMALGIGEVR